jgi:hypothetical protein
MGVKTTWSYDGEKGLMTLCDFYGEPVLTLPLTIPESHALARFIENRDAEVNEDALQGFYEKIGRLIGK